MTARRKMRASLGESWGDASYSSNDGASIHSASDATSEVELEESDKDVARGEDEATPLPPKTKRLSSSQPQITPSKNNSDKTAARRMQMSESTPRPHKKQGTARSAQGEPSLIMPTISNAINNGISDGSPLRNSQARSRNVRRASKKRNSATPPRSPPRSTPQPTPRPARQQELGPWHYVNLFYEHVAWPLAQYFGEVFAYAMRHFVKPFLGVALGIGLLYFGATTAMGLFRSTLATAFSPVCLVPGSSYVLPFCASLSHNEHRADFEELVNVQSRFEEILDASKDTSSLPSTIKDSEIAIRDLRTLVRHSRLPSRHQLDLEFENFVLTANEASVDLSRYNSRIGATMDRVIATNTWTLAVLQGIEEKEASIGAVDRVIGAMTSVFVAPPLTLQQRIFDQYLLHVSKNKEEITRLIQTAQALLLVLQNLDERLDTIYQIATNDDTTISRSQDELLASLWTKLGANSKSVKANNKHLHLLRHVSAYRKKALMHVADTLLKLREIQAELENLREGVAAPEVLGWRSELPLTYHLDLIERGVERLRVARGESVRVEGETYRRLVRGGEEVKELPGGKEAAQTVTVRAK